MVLKLVMLLGFLAATVTFAIVHAEDVSDQEVAEQFYGGYGGYGRGFGGYGRGYGGYGGYGRGFGGYGGYGRGFGGYGYGK